jgi:hypothetical protein
MFTPEEVAHFQIYRELAEEVDIGGESGVPIELLLARAKPVQQLQTAPLGVIANLWSDIFSVEKPPIFTLHPEPTEVRIRKTRVF